MTRLTRGYVQVYTGTGKGKTTAALGLALRAALSGLSVFIGQFMKGSDYAELAMADIPFAGLTGGKVLISQYGTPRLICQGEKPTDDDRSMARAGLVDITGRLASGETDVIIADEILVTVHFGLLGTLDVLDLMKRRPDHVELVLTGRGAPPEVVERADLVTDMRNVRHYYDTLGVLARRGIEH